MKNFLQNLLIFLALCLCALIAFQWVRETDLRRKIQKLTDEVHDKSQDILNLKSTVHHDEMEIERLDGLRIQLTATVKTNEAEIARMTKELDKADRENQRLGIELENYKVAFTNANDRIKQQNITIKELSDSVKTLAHDHNTIITNLNAMSQTINDMTIKWTGMGEAIQKATPAAQREMAVTNLIVMTGDFNGFITRWNKMQQDLQHSRTNETSNGK